MKINMKLHIESIDLTKEDISDFLSTALFHSPSFSCVRLDEYKEMEGKESECFEDKCANVLLAGGKIAIVDYVAEGEVNGPARGVEAHQQEDGEVYYHISLKSLKNGLKRALEGEGADAKYAMFNFMYDDGSFDATDADNLLQMIIFGEVVYG